MIIFKFAKRAFKILKFTLQVSNRLIIICEIQLWFMRCKWMKFNRKNSITSLCRAKDIAKDISSDTVVGLSDKLSRRSSRIRINSTFFTSLFVSQRQPWHECVCTCACARAELFRLLSPFNARWVFQLDTRCWFILIKSSEQSFLLYVCPPKLPPLFRLSSSSSLRLCFVENYKRRSHAG
jgi:hypothetical protein